MADKEALFLEIEKIHEDAIIPKRQTVEAAGYDLHSYVNEYIYPGNRKLISTGLRMKLPHGTWGCIRSRSSLAVQGIDVKAGTIDEDYRGEIFVLLANNSRMKFDIKKGERIAQIIVCPYLAPEVKESKLDISVRGTGGFGSTGK